jgi:O-antigen ligase
MVTSATFRPGHKDRQAAPVSGWRIDQPRVLLHVSLILVGLAYLPLIPGDPALAAGFTPSRMYETFFIVFGFALMPIYLLLQGQSLSTRLYPHLPMLAFSGWVLLSVLWSLHPVLTLSKGIQLTAIVIGALLYADAFRRFRTAEHDFANTLAIVLLVLVLTGLIANTFIWGTPFAMGGTEVLNEGVEARPRLRIAYGHPGFMGYLAAFGIMSVYASGFRWTYKLPALFLLLYVLRLTDSRSGSIALLFAVIAMILIKRRWKACLVALYLAGWTALGYLTVVNMGARPDDLLYPVRPLLPEDLETLNGRTEVWSLAFEYIRDSPILGIGYYSARFILLPVFYWAGDTHNTWIEILLSLGLFGLLFAVLFLVSSFAIAFRTRNALALGVLVFSLCYTMTSIPLFVPDYPMVIVLLCVNDARSSLITHRVLSLTSTHGEPSAARKAGHLAARRA